MAALADTDVEYVVHRFPHPCEGQVLPCMEVAGQRFDIGPVAYRRAYALGEVGHRPAATSALPAIGTVFRPYGPDRRYVHYLARPFRCRRQMPRRRSAGTAIVRAEFHDMVRARVHLKGIALVPRLPTGPPAGGLPKALVPLGTVDVPRGRDRTVAAVLGVSVSPKAIAQFGVFPFQLEYAGLQPFKANDTFRYDLVLVDIDKIRHYYP